MRTRIRSGVSTRIAVAALLALAVRSAVAQTLPPVSYTVRMIAPETHVATVEARIPTDGRGSVELMMPVWSPGYYVQENYATRVLDLGARTPDGKDLPVDQPQPNRWHVQSNGAPLVVLTYHLQCDRRSVTGDWVGPDYAVLNGAPTFITLVEQAHRPHDVLVELPAQWKQTATSLTAATDGTPNHYRAADYDELVDSPIVAGNISFHTFVVGGAAHILADIGEVPAQWDGALAAKNLEKFVTADYAFWGFLPFKKYVFLNVFRQGGGGLEHLNSTLLTSSPKSVNGGDMRWLQYVSHEYFHAFNVKRLRPVELGPFDYEHAPRTPTLWISEGVTTYYGNLMASRGGLGTPEDVLKSLSSDITSLQNSPGRLIQTLEQASLGIFATGGSGVGGDRNKVVSYYTKGFIVGFLLDAHIQHVTNGRKSFDDLMRLAYQRYAGARGFTPEQWVATASEVAGVDMTDWFHRAIQTTDELSYDEALDWFGLRFAASADSAKAWTLEIRPDATPAEKARWQKLTAAGQSPPSRDSSGS
jgi:predicted metalloprotease with PDZ domain